MNARLAHRRADAAHAQAVSRSVYDGQRLLGRAHPLDDGRWLAEDADGEVIGRFGTVKEAAHKIALAGQRVRP